MNSKDFFRALLGIVGVTILWAVNSYTLVIFGAMLFILIIADSICDTIRERKP